ncbi:translation initiation factor IF-2 [Kineothrix sp. MB12-C1]|uniref:translation initiation factor IF-2 n=1 Tax=Kineothrix sp. MB12-C1 TaxID=3070215 RepID=UPI0027D2735B|nr:translation initiation factor IF-2 [Kineothrix sp. MB12-C1]WMC92958.1 translation initiation factor IF-2 [Kineothrix sp. MB12-C1]
MAKIKVHELAKELDKQSKEVIAFLQGKGIEVKAPQSSLEEDAVVMVRKQFGKEGAGTTKPEITKQEMVKPNKEEVRAEQETADEPKKKKKIIFVSNPHNSKMPGQKSSQQGHGQNQGNDRRPAAQQRNSNQRRNNNAPEPYRPVRPLTPPSPTPPVTMVPASNNMPKKEAKPAMKEEALARNTVEEKVQTPAEGTRSSAPAQTRTAQPARSNYNANGDNNRGTYNNNRADGNSRNRSDNNNRPYNNNRTDGGDNTRPYGNNRPDGGRSGDNNRPYNNNRTDGTRSNNNNRPYNNNRTDGTRSDNNNRPYNNNRTDGTRSDNNNRPYNNNRTDGTRPDNNNRPYNNNRPARPPFERNQAGQNDRRGYSSNQNGSRPYNNNDGNNRGNAGPDNRFRKPMPGKGFAAESPVKEPKKHSRDEEKRRIGQERDKRSGKDLMYEEDVKAQNKAGRFIKPEKKMEETKEERIKVITISDFLTIKELADKMKLQPSIIIKKLFLQGQIVTVNSEISYEEAENIAIEYDIICEKEIKVDVIEELLKEEDEIEEELTTRPPVICVMGHVDHGKTSLLDAIRKTNVTNREAGGITQHIGAYMVTVGDQKITFLDTPGHEAFTAMRMRGANSTDIAILVVAADDGVMPQTVEAINHAKAAGIEIIVAVNKVDKPSANMDRVKQEMTEYELIPVDWGGTTEFVPVSAKSGEGIDTLLETIVLTSEILELKANPERHARGLVIEAELDKGRGPVATVLVQKGTLRVGDFISAGASYGKVRAMIDDKGRRVKEASPSTPVEILGLSDVPSAGEVFIVHENDKTARSYAETYLAQNKEKMLEDTKAKMSLDDLFTKIQAGNLKELNLIVKADVQGSVEAVKQSLLKLSNEEVIVKCIHGGVGAINESDVSLASASQAIIIGFNVRPDATAKTISEREGVDIRLYKVIYQAIEDIEAAMKGMLDPVFEEKVIGHAEVRQIFKASAIGNIAGSYVLDGMFKRDSKVRVTREGELIFEGELASLKRFKDDVKEVKAGFECGLVFDGFDQIQEFDIVEAYTMVEVPR